MSKKNYPKFFIARNHLRRWLKTSPKDNQKIEISRSFIVIVPNKSVVLLWTMWTNVCARFIELAWVYATMVCMGHVELDWKVFSTQPIMYVETSSTQLIWVVLGWIVLMGYTYMLFLYDPYIV